MLKKVVHTNKYLILIFLCTLLFRLAGIGHTLPQIAHPDEPTIVQSALAIRFYKNPAHFDWPHLYIYVNYFAYMVFAKARNFMFFVPKNSIIFDDKQIFYVVTRSLSSLFGALTVFPIFFVAKDLFNKKVAYFSAMTFAVLPFHIWHSQYTMPDVPMTFFVALAFYFSVQIFLNGQLLDYILAGLFVGFAASTKYNGGLMALVVLLAHVLRFIPNFKLKRFLLKGVPLIFSGAVSILGFLMGTPYALLDYKTFIRTDGPKGALWQFTNVGSVPFATRLSEFFTLFVTQHPKDFGVSVMLVFIFGIIFTVGMLLTKRHSHAKQILLVLIPALFMFYYVAGFAKSRAQYFLPAYPFVSVACGYFVFTLVEFLYKLKNYFLAKVFIATYFFAPLLAVVVNNLKRFGF